MMAWWFIGGGIFAAFGLLVSMWLCSGNLEEQASETQKEAVREWLLYAVTIAEAQWGGGTGRLKLRHVYDRFAWRFPDVVRLVPFNTFSEWVDEALVEMRKMLETNPAVKKITEWGIGDGVDETM